MKYVCIKEFTYLSKYNEKLKFKFLLNDSVTNIVISTEEGFRDNRISFIYGLNTEVNAPLFQFLYASQKI